MKTLFIQPRVHCAINRKVITSTGKDLHGSFGYVHSIVNDKVAVFKVFKHGNSSCNFSVRFPVEHMVECLTPLSNVEAKLLTKIIHKIS